MTDSTPQKAHASCIGHVQLGLVGRTIESQLLVTHARLTLPKNTGWDFSNGEYDSEKELTVRQITDNTYLTLGQEDGRREAHIMLTRRAHPYDTQEDWFIRNLVIDFITEERMFIDAAVECLDFQGDEEEPATAKSCCYTQNFGELLVFLGSTIHGQNLREKSPYRALPRAYFMLGEPRS